MPVLSDQLAREQEARQSAEARMRQLKYRAADGVGGALGMIGLRRPLRLVASWVFGRQGAIEIVATIGDYVMAGLMLTAVDQQLPEDRKPLLPPR